MLVAVSQCAEDNALTELKKILKEKKDYPLEKLQFSWKCIIGGNMEILYDLCPICELTFGEKLKFILSSSQQR